jgi:hypothetical protein
VSTIELVLCHNIGHHRDLLYAVEPNGVDISNQSHFMLNVFFSHIFIEYSHIFQALAVIFISFVNIVEYSQFI